MTTTREKRYDEIIKFVKTHAMITQDPFVDYPSFFYHAIWKGVEYRATSEECLIDQITDGGK